MKNVIIRNLSEVQADQIEKLKDLFGEKSGTKAILKCLEVFQLTYDQNIKLEAENEKLQTEIKLYQSFAENLKWEISLLPQNDIEK